MALKNLKNKFFIIIFLNAFGCNYLTKDPLNAKQKYLATIRSPQSPIIYNSKIVWNEGDKLIVFDTNNNMLSKTTVSYPFYKYLYPSSPDIITDAFSYYLNPQCDNSENLCKSRDRYKDSIWIIKKTGETASLQIPTVCRSEIIDANGYNIICINGDDIVEYNYYKKSTSTIFSGKYKYLQRDNLFLYLYSARHEDYTIYVIEKANYKLLRKIQLEIKGKVEVLKLYRNVIAYINASGLVLYNYVTRNKKVFPGEQYSSCEIANNDRYVVTFRENVYSIIDIEKQKQYRIQNTNVSIGIDSLLCTNEYCYIVEIHKILPLQTTYKIRKIKLKF